MQWNTRHLLATVFLFSSYNGLMAQESGAPIAAPVAQTQFIETFTFDGNAVTTTVLPMPVISAMPVASPMLYYPGGSSSGGVNFNSLHDPSVMKELELVDDQITRIANIRKEFNQRRQKLAKEFSKPTKAGDDQDKMKNYQQDYQELEADQKEALSDILLPHQLDRIKQVNQQMQMQAMGGASGALQHGWLAKELDISDEQKKNLAAIQKKMREDIAAKTQEIRAAAKKQVLRELTADQKEKFANLTGDEFKRNPKDWQTHRQRTFTKGPKK